MALTIFADFENQYLFKDGDTITKDRLNGGISVLKKELNTFEGTISVLTGEALPDWKEYKVYSKGDWVSYNDKNYKSVEDLNYNSIPGTSSAWVESSLNSVAVSGNLEDLDFSATTVIDAINKVNVKADTNTSNIGYLSSLSTTAKSNLVSSINEIVDSKGQPNGIASIDSTGKIFADQLPSYVDDVVEYTNFVSFPVTGEAGKIYVDTMSSISYRWSGSVYTAISSGDVDWQYVRATPTTLAGYGITDSASLNSPSFVTKITTPFIDMTYASFDDIDITLSTLSQTPLDLGPDTTYRSIELLIQGERGTDVHVTKMNIVHNGSTSWNSEYGTVFSNGSLATFSSDLSGGNIRLLITPSSSSTTNFKILASFIKI